jgi:hypothetical protein
MAVSYDGGGHRETTLLPDPLARHAVWRLGTWALPATTISVASLVVFAVVLGFLSRNAQLRALFTLPLDPALPGFTAAAVAWSVAWSCRCRPGRPWPRYFALCLSAMASLVAVLCSLPVVRREPFVQALALSSLAASLTLAARQLRIRPDSPWLERIAPATVLLVLGFLLPATYLLASAAVDLQRRRLAMRIERLEAFTHEVQEAAAHDWTKIASEPKPAARMVERLREMSPRALLPDGEAWRAAAALGLDSDLARAVGELSGAVVRALDPQVGPRVSTLMEPAVYWDADAKRWVESARFETVSETTRAYYRELGRVFVEVGSLLPAATEPVRAGLADLYQDGLTHVRDSVDKLRLGFTDGWVVQDLPPELAGGQAVPLVEILTAPMLPPLGPSQAVHPTAADVTALLDLTLFRARALAGRGLQGCLFRPDYEEGGHTYARLDCPTYLPRQSGGSGAELRAEVRVVYRSERSWDLRPSQRPVEIFYLFPIPEGVQETSFRQAVMNDLATALAWRGQGDARPKDRSGALAEGFSLTRNGIEVVKMLRATRERFLDGRSILVVRAVPSSD